MKYCIVGGGHFGWIAAQAFFAHDVQAEIDLVDRDEAVCERWRSHGVRATCISGPHYLSDLLRPEKNGSENLPDWIIPTVPIHLAYEWLAIYFADHYQFDPMAVPDQVAAQLPNTMTGAGRALYFSLADFRCPDKCPAPADHCVHTGKPRPASAWELSAGLCFRDFKAISVFSDQLHPGVGGYRPTALLTAAEQVQAADGWPILLSTACRCHGVMHAFRIRKIA